MLSRLFKLAFWLCDDVEDSLRSLGRLVHLPFQNIADALLDIPGERHPELKMALTAFKEPCAFDDPNYWVRGIIDLLIINGKSAYIVDYKTGSAKYPDPDQLKLMAAMVFAHYPEITFIKSCLIFVLHDVIVDEQYRRDELDKIWSKFAPTLSRLQLSFDNDVWPPNPTPLCGWCPVRTCDFHKVRG